MLVKWAKQIKNTLCANVNNIPWDHKKSQVYFHGALTGQAKDENGNYINRLKLMHLSNDNPDLIHFGLSDTSFNFKDEDIPDKYKDTLYFREELCTRMDFKYMITIDGMVSPWGRGPLILYSDSVLLVVESSN